MLKKIVLLGIISLIFSHGLNVYAYAQQSRMIAIEGLSLIDEISVSDSDYSDDEQFVEAVPPVSVNEVLFLNVIPRPDFVFFEYPHHVWQPPKRA